jgi:uncharacterized protein
VGLHGDEIRIRIAAPPVDGAANDALIRLVAERLGVPPSAVEVRGGAGARSKTLMVAGVTPAAATHRLGLGPVLPSP